MSSGKKSGKVLHSQSRKLVSNVTRYFQLEKDHGSPLKPLNQVVSRAADACQVSERTIARIRKESEAGESNCFTTPGKSHKNPKPVTNIDSFTADAIRRHIYAYYAEKRVPTIRQLLISLNSAQLYEGGKSSLHKILKALGFAYMKLNNRVVLLEKPDIVLKRVMFLRAIRTVDWNKFSSWTRHGSTKT